MQKNAEITLLASTGRDTDTASGDVTNDVFRGGHIVVNVSTRADAAQTVKVTVQGKVPGTTGTYYTVLQSTALSTGRTILKVYPGLPGLANAVASDVLPHTWRVNSTLASTHSIGYGISAHLIT